ncbi:hypothetical protein FACS1894200_08000 [Spirochaetia bacterium]|nr:hypothetical protein FACS1894200_08000 [Spirochaetia bacterium]
MTIEQTVEIPPSRRLTIDVPRDIPAGPVILTFTPKLAGSAKPEKPSKSATPITDRIAGIAAHLEDFTREQICEEGTESATPITDFLSGICASAGDITLEQIREERLVNKYLK